MNLSRCPSLRELLDFERRSYDDLLRKSQRISQDLKIAKAKIRKNKHLIQRLKRQRWYLVSKIKRSEDNVRKLNESTINLHESNQARFRGDIFSYVINEVSKLSSALKPFLVYEDSSW